MRSLIFYWFPKWVDWDIEDLWSANSDSQMQCLQENKNWPWISPLTITEKPSGEFPSDAFRKAEENNTGRNEVAWLFKESMPEWNQENVEVFYNWN